MTSSSITVYGIPNCDTVKKARAWLTQQQAEYVFHDFKKQGASRELIDAWMAVLPWEKLLNRQGTTWRKLPADVQATVHDAASAAELLRAHSSLIKRPVVHWPGPSGTVITVGFDPAAWLVHLQTMNAA